MPHSCRRLRSSSGRPSSSPSTRSGSGQAKRSITSTRPSASNPSIRSEAIWATRGSSSAIRRGVKAFVTSPRMRSCSGGSISMMNGMPGQPSASTSRTSGGYGSGDDLSAPVEENVS